MNTSSLATKACCALVLTACLRPSEPAREPLSATGSSAPAQSATLEGYVVELDGKYPTSSVAKSTLSPGCHVLVAGAVGPYPISVGTTSSHSGNRRMRYFVFDAKASHHYKIEHTYESIPNRLGPRGVVRREVLSLVETDEHGTEVRRLRELSDETAPHSC